MKKPNPCIDCPKRSPFCHADCSPYLEWAAEKRAENKAIRDASLADTFLRTNYVNYMRRAEGQRAIRMYIHK
jgi:hypothetical protein